MAAISMGATTGLGGTTRGVIDGALNGLPGTTLGEQKGL